MAGEAGGAGMAQEGGDARCRVYCHVAPRRHVRRHVTDYGRRMGMAHEHGHGTWTWTWHMAHGHGTWTWQVALLPKTAGGAPP